MRMLVQAKCDRQCFMIGRSPSSYVLYKACAAGYMREGSRHFCTHKGRTATHLGNDSIRDNSSATRSLKPAYAMKPDDSRMQNQPPSGAVALRCPNTPTCDRLEFRGTRRASFSMRAVGRRHGLCPERSPQYRMPNKNMDKEFRAERSVE